MTLPGLRPAQLAAIDDVNRSTMVQLRTMKHADPRDIPRLRETLRERLWSYVDVVLALADESAAS
jgi:hypothetical protein